MMFVTQNNGLERHVEHALGHKRTVAYSLFLLRDSLFDCGNDAQTVNLPPRVRSPLPPAVLFVQRPLVRVDRLQALALDFRLGAVEGRSQLDGLPPSLPSLLRR